MRRLLAAPYPLPSKSMSELENHIELPPGDTGSSLLVLQQQVATLRALLAGCLAALFSLSLVLIAFLYVQDRLIRRDLAGARQLVLDYETNKKPVINALIVKLQGFAQH